MRRRRLCAVLRLLVATLACVVVGALLHPTTAAAAESAPPPARPAPVSAVPEGLPALTGRVTNEQAAAWHLDGDSVTTRTTPGGSTVVFTPNAAADGGSDGGSDGGADFKAKVRWWGYYLVLFNKLETLRIAAGAAACAAVVKFVPVVGQYLSADCALISVFATYARARNRCLLVQGWGLGVPQPLMYHGGYCR